MIGVCSSRNPKGIWEAMEVLWEVENLSALGWSKDSRKRSMEDLCRRIRQLNLHLFSGQNLPHLILLAPLKDNTKLNRKSRYQRPFHNKKWVLDPMLDFLRTATHSMQYRELRLRSVTQFKVLKILARELKVRQLRIRNYFRTCVSSNKTRFIWAIWSFRKNWDPENPISPQWFPDISALELKSP